MKKGKSRTPGHRDTSHSGPSAHFDTLAVHAGQEPDPATGAIMTPVYLTSTYVQEYPGRHKGYDYSRSANPTRAALEKNLAALEGGRGALCFSSGVAAIAAVVQTLAPGDHVVSGRDVYGGTYRLFSKVFAGYGIKFSFVDTTRLDEIRRALGRRTKLLWLETPSNPLLTVTDIRAAAALARERGVLVAVDNTFASPALQRPLDLGADVVVHSTTKYLGGHSDVVGGCVAVRDAALFERLKFIQNAVGAVPGPMDCFLVLRGTKTLALRMRRHCENAGELALRLAANPDVLRVHYPGLAGHPGREIARAQMSGFGGMISFELRGSAERAMRMASLTKIFSLAESLGGVESLISHPPSMTHGSIPRRERLKYGLADGLIRLSVGVEDVRDLAEDLERAIALSRNFQKKA